MNINYESSLVINSNPIVSRGSNSLDTLFAGSPFVIESLYWHNAFRKIHNSPALALSSELCEKAQEWANSLTHKDVFYHKNDEEIGENLLLKCSNFTNLDINGEEVTKLWYSEIDKYAFHLSPCLLHTQANRFTQLVWKDTREFGIGKAKTREGKLIVVANYRPAGNVVGEYHLNVLPITENEEEDDGDDDSDSNCSDRPIHFECRK
ncbi:uncharacterized protein B4U80_06696 [Leptotrombidium deliense]|uniref:SCP domain-containing protein n=1 Tax=Leptotrombidium deliense TaxID=299467 RepID=A0A443S9N2_9ACAR|nr:uncharacterized protein B4U80_06696 [Leptotrombidium deliense]